MSCRYAIFPEHNLLVVIAPSGHMHNEDLLAKLKVYEDPEYRVGMNEIHDYRDVTTSDIYPETVRLFAEIAAEHEKKFRDARVVFVRPRDLVYSVITMFRDWYEKNSTESHFHFELFTSMEDARQSLGIDPGLSFDVPMKILAF